MLTQNAVRAARPKPRAYKLADERGLYLLVMPTGTKSFRLRYRDQVGHEQTLTFGPISLADARARRDAARALLERGEDPRPRAIAVTTFEEAARAWHAHRTEGWSPVHAGDVLECLERDAFPPIGTIALGSITRPMVLELLERVEARGAIVTARRLRQRIQGVFKFARAKGWTTIANPADDVGEALAAVPAQDRQPALVDVDELRGLVDAVAALDASPILLLASRFLALTAVRLAALRGMRWQEVEDLDGREPVWRVPAARMKLKAANKLMPDNDQFVPLSPAAAGVLRAARAIAGGAPAHDALVFVGRGGDTPIGTGAIGELYARAGYAGRHVPHGWRASFSTVMNERLPGRRADIERTLGHGVAGMKKEEKAYNRAKHLPARRELLEEWSTVLLGD